MCMYCIGIQLFPSSLFLFLHLLHLSLTLSQAEELIKQEMLVMLRHDLIHNPPPTGGSKSKSNISVVKNALEKNPLESFTEEELENVCQV